MNSTLIDKFDNWVFDTFRSSPESLAMLRIFYAAYMILITGFPRFGWISQVPDYFFDPPEISIAGVFFSGFPNAAFFTISGAMICLLYTCLLFGYRTRLVSILITPLLILNLNFIYSFGKINHDTLFFTIIPIIMSFSNWGAVYSLDSKQGNNSSNEIHYWPITLLAVIYGFVLFSAAVPKLFSGYLDPSYQAVYAHVDRYYHAVGRDMFLLPFFVTFKNVLFWEFFDYGAVIWELLFLPAIFHKPTFRFFILIAILFHFVNLLMLNITFANILPIYLFFLNWSAFMNFLKNRNIDTFLDKLITARNFLIVLLLSFAHYLIFDYPEPILLISTKTGIYISFVLMLLACIFAIIDLIVSLRRKPA